jgi:glycosyltransferase involved in cell wall biosynthesis
VVVPAYNEEQGLAVVLDKLLAVTGAECEVLVVDDGSADATAAVAARYPVRLVSHARNQGKAEAMRTGIREAWGENVLFIDADDTYPAEALPLLLEALRSHDMAVASRVGGKAHIPAFNRIGNAIFRQSIRILYGYRAYDPLTGFYGLKKRHLEAMKLQSNGFRIETEIAIKAARMGLSIADFPIEYRERIGEAKLRGLKDGFAIFLTIVSMLPRYRPAIFWPALGAVVLLLVAIYILAR